MYLQSLINELSHNMVHFILATDDKNKEKLVFQVIRGIQGKKN